MYQKQIYGVIVFIIPVFFLGSLISIVANSNYGMVSLAQEVIGSHRGTIINREQLDFSIALIQKRSNKQKTSLPALAKAILINGNPEQAIEVMRHATFQGEHPVNSFFLGNAYNEIGQVDLAISEWRKAGAASYFFRLATQAQDNENDYSKAEEFYKTALAVNPDLVAVRVALGLMYWESVTDVERAKQVFREATNIKVPEKNKNDLATQKMALGYLAILEGRRDNATEAFLQAIKLNQTSWETWRAHNWLGIIYFDAGDFELAEPHFYEVRKQQPQKPSTYSYLAKVCLYEKEWNCASDYLEQFINFQPNNEEAYILLAQVYRNKSELDKAEKLFLEALEVLPNSVDLHLGLADFYLHTGDIELARYEYEQVLVLDDKHEWATHQLTEIINPHSD